MDVNRDLARELATQLLEEHDTMWVCGAPTVHMTTPCPYCREICKVCGPTQECNVLPAARILEELVTRHERALAVCAGMERGVGYRVSGDHDTWGAHTEGKSDMAGEIADILEGVN